MKRYRYKKIKPEDIVIMKKLREQGISYREIGRRFDVTWRTPYYHLNPKEKKALTKAQIKEKNKKSQPYLNQYIKERYNNDPDFRRDFLDMVARNFKKRITNWVKLGLCSRCGKERKDKEYNYCEKCREVCRKKYHTKKSKTKK